MSSPTDPKIFTAQNLEDNRRLVAAQARMYSDAKVLYFGRVVAVFVIGLATVALAVAWPTSRALIGGGGGLLLFAASLVIETVEKRRRLEAAATQELFDTRVFQLEWSSIHTSRPSMAEVAKADKRYRGGRDTNWYDDTGHTARPFDVLMCQASNLGWGATMHRLWGWILTAGLTALVLAVGFVWYILGLTVEAAVLALLVPLLAPAKELVTLIRTNFENAATKEAADRQIAELWESGLTEKVIPTDRQLRALQDKILILRQTNSYVPDWLDAVFYRKNESAMRATVSDRVSQAQRSGFG